MNGTHCLCRLCPVWPLATLYLQYHKRSWGRQKAMLDRLDWTVYCVSCVKSSVLQSSTKPLGKSDTCRYPPECRPHGGTFAGQQIKWHLQGRALWKWKGHIKAPLNRPVTICRQEVPAIKLLLFFSFFRRVLQVKKTHSLRAGRSCLSNLCVLSKFLPFVSTKFGPGARASRGSRCPADRFR